MCTQEWSLIPSRLIALTLATCQQAFSPSSALHALEDVRSLRVPLGRHLDPHLRDRLGGGEARFALGLLGSRLVDALAELLVEPRHGRRDYSLRPRRYDSRVMRTMNPVHDATCSVAACAEILGAKWTAVLVHDLSEGPRRFTQLEHSCQGISPRTLSERLRALEQEEIVVRRSYAESPPRVEYELTEKGEALLPIIDEMRRFGHDWLVD
jgi:DNA-binding HxlR family transcriptional regulator